MSDTSRWSEAVASFRTDVERAADAIRSRDESRSRAELVAQCRDALERLRNVNADAAPRLDELCDRIRTTAPGDEAGWKAIKEELENLRRHEAAIGTGDEPTRRRIAVELGRLRPEERDVGR